LHEVAQGTEGADDGVKFGEELLAQDSEIGGKERSRGGIELEQTLIEASDEVVSLTGRFLERLLHERDLLWRHGRSPLSPHSDIRRAGHETIRWSVRLHPGSVDQLVVVVDHLEVLDLGGGERPRVAALDEKRRYLAEEFRLGV